MKICEGKVAIFKWAFEAGEGSRKHEIKEVLTLEFESWLDQLIGPGKSECMLF